MLSYKLTKNDPINIKEAKDVVVEFARQKK